MSDGTPKYVVVVGASAGGFNSIIELAAQLNDKIDAAVFVVMHLGHVQNPEMIAERIQKSTSFTCRIAKHEEPIKTHHIYIASPNKHLLVNDGKMLFGEGPQENRWRPSIDVLFRSAAVHYSNRAIGIILSGLMQDGTSGMLAIKRCGGTCIVQDPTEAEFKDMPMMVMSNVDVDYCATLCEMGAILEEKTKKDMPVPNEIPKDVRVEAAISQRVAVDQDLVADIAEKSRFACPDCGGGLWEIKDEKMSRYRCHVGHVYTQDELACQQQNALENTLWMALRMMEERKQLLEKMMHEENSKGWLESVEQKKLRIVELKVHIERLKMLLFDAKHTYEATNEGGD